MADCNKQGDGEGEPGVHVIFQICTILIVEITYQMDEFRQKISGRSCPQPPKRQPPVNAPYLDAPGRGY